MNKKFKSIFKDEMESFMNYKKSCGYECSVYVYNRYSRLDNYFYEAQLKEKVINQKIVDDWLKLFDKGKASNRFENGVSVIKSFSKFLIRNNYKNIIIPEITVKSIDFIPHIYSDSEIKSIFNYARYLKETGSKCRNYDANYVILCLLFGCGLRINEVIHLTLDSIDMREKSLCVYKGKNGVSRIVPMSESVFKTLSEYLNQNEYENENSRIFLNKFPNATKKFLEAYSFRRYFSNILKRIDIAPTYEGKMPRVHDIRHTFAVKTLEQMETKGVDIYTSISILSIYLGHVSIVETEKYLRLIPSVAQKINKKVTDYTSNIYKRKEVYHEE